MNAKPNAFFSDDGTILRNVDNLLGQMSLEEKIGQMVQVDLSWKENLERALQEGKVGSILSVRDPRRFNQLQEIAVNQSRLGIPLILANDVIHGYRTIFPIPFAQACTWDIQLIEEITAAIRREALANGTHWNFAPMADLCRDPRWGRVAEGFGEDPYLGSIIARTQVMTLQSTSHPAERRLAACLKHFAAYGAVEAGKDYNTVDMSERRLRDVYLPAYHSAIEAGVATVMTAFNELNGIPATANRFLLHDLLRREWDFQGVIVSDYDAIGELILHGFARDLREAAYLSIQAGVDIDMMGNAYHFHLADLVRSDEVPERWIDQAVRRILSLKYHLGVFDHPFIPNPDAVIAIPENYQIATTAAEKAAVLLKNDRAVLPLDPNLSTIALIGPLAKARKDLLGSWACEGQLEEVITLFDGLHRVLPEDTQLIHAEGCSVNGDENEFTEAVEAAQRADLVILALGETEAMSGEAHSRAHLGLPGSQSALVDALHATGKPIVAVVFSGRPLILSGLDGRVQAVLMAWQGGTTAGLAVARLLTGQTNPSGKLCMSIPRCEGQIPIYYSHKSTGRPADCTGVFQFNQEHKSIYIDEKSTPLYPFGYGMSYSHFGYSNLNLESARVRLDGHLIVSALITNGGPYNGEETVQCYVCDRFGSITRPVKELKGFQRIVLKEGESKRVRFMIPAASFGYYNQSMQYGTTPGEFKVWIGPNSQEGLEASFHIEG